VRDLNHEFSGVKSVVLDANDIDLLELVRFGVLPPTVLHHHLNELVEVMLQDQEGTPLSFLSTATIQHLRPLAEGFGPAWDPELRVSPAALPHSPGPRIAFVAFCPPSDEELKNIVERSTNRNATSLILCAAVSRAPRPREEVQASGLTRSLLGAATQLREEIAPTSISVVIIPWPSAIVSTAEMLEPYGATEAIFGARELPPSAPIGYPETSALEINAARLRSSTTGATVLFTGLSGSGKSTIARALVESLRDEGFRNVELLDGDLIRQTISSDLGFDRDSRNENLRRLGKLAAEIATGGSIAVAAPIAPFDTGRSLARQEAIGVPFLLVYISTPLEVCESRDRKGLYAKARQGTIVNFTGISSPYEIPNDADLVIDTTVTSVPIAVNQIKNKLLPLIS